MSQGWSGEEMKSFMLWSLAIIFSLIETAHFGWNKFPQSDAEFICDGIAVILIALAIKSK